MGLAGVVLAAACALIGGSEATKVAYVLGCPVVEQGSCPDNKHIHFNLFTRSNPTGSQVLDLEADNLLETSFNAANPTKIIIHGFTGNSSDVDVVEMVKQFLVHGDYNLIAVDWSVLAENVLCYPTAVHNAKHLGACVAQLVERLRTAPTEDIHLIGHSLGGQTCGYVANHLRPYLLPRITGLDPAGPLFETTSKAEELDATDAAFVDVIHTNIHLLGKAAPFGHVDFYLNKDGSTQPGCGFRAVCSHFRSFGYYSESINTEKGFYGKQCINYFTATTGLCYASSKPRTVLMGEHVLKTSRGIVSVPTASQSPYALGR